MIVTTWIKHLLRQCSFGEGLINYLGEIPHAVASQGIDMRIKTIANVIYSTLAIQ